MCVVEDDVVHAKKTLGVRSTLKERTTYPDNNALDDANALTAIAYTAMEQDGHMVSTHMANSVRDPRWEDRRITGS